MTDWQSIIDSAKIVLSTLEENSDEYNSLVRQINMAESKLKDAKEIINLKNNELEEHKKTILFISLFLATLIAALIILFYFFKKIKSLNSEIIIKNKKIISSIEYASLIQNALLSKPEELNNLFEDAFCFYKPKDIVSGDFYWFKDIDNKIVVAVSDCTGHGVPGALLTMLGISALEDIVSQNKITDPGKIMDMLDASISEKLKDDNPYQLNGMDISILMYDKKSHELFYCGAMREINIVTSNGEVTECKPELASIASGRLKTPLKTQKIEVNKGDIAIMYSDGYQDQFKGGIEGVETYNYKRFQNLLSKIGKEGKLNKIDELLENDFNAWKLDKEQVDDVLILGVRF